LTLASNGTESKALSRKAPCSELDNIAEGVKPTPEQALTNLGTEAEFTRIHAQMG
jgi:hypothetical protein